MQTLTWPQRVTIREVGLRDGLQSIARTLPTAQKLQWIEGAYNAGLREIEVGSFVPPKLLPQLADTAELVAFAKTLPGLKASVLVPTLQGPAQQDDDARALVRQLTKQAEGLRPQHLLLAALRAAALAWQVHHLASLPCRGTQHARPVQARTARARTPAAPSHRGPTHAKRLHLVLKLHKLVCAQALKISVFQTLHSAGHHVFGLCFIVRRHRLQAHRRNGLNICQRILHALMQAVLQGLRLCHGKRQALGGVVRRWRLAQRSPIGIKHRMKNRNVFGLTQPSGL